jgi:hypothetical protein
MHTPISQQNKVELLQALRQRYLRASKQEKAKILDEFVAVAGCHRKHAIRLLSASNSASASVPALARRTYDEAVRQALIVLWEAADPIGGKRLKAALPSLITALERHGHLALHAIVRQRVLAVSGATPYFSPALSDDGRWRSDGKRDQVGWSLAVAGRGFAGHRRAILPSVEPSRPQAEPRCFLPGAPRTRGEDQHPFLRSGSRWSVKHLANWSMKWNLASTSRRSSPPASAVTGPPSKWATTSHRRRGWKKSAEGVQSVMARWSPQSGSKGLQLFPLCQMRDHRASPMVRNRG